jgi:hypothetical protein
MDNKILLYGFLLRILLVFIGEVNDYYTSSRGGNGGYSDIDYSVKKLI